jgi:hypothetical protein
VDEEDGTFSSLVPLSMWQGTVLLNDILESICVLNRVVVGFFVQIGDWCRHRDVRFWMMAFTDKNEVA